MIYGRKYYANDFPWLSDEEHYKFLNYIAAEKYSFLDDCNNVLEIGVGLGQNIYKRFKNAVGIDISDFAVRECKKRGINAFVMSATDLKFKNSSFDGIISSHTLEHIRNYETAITEMARVLRNKGKLCLTLPEPDRKQDETHYCTWKPFEMAKLLKENGFNVLYWKRTDYKLVRIFKDMRPMWLARWFCKIIGKLGKSREYTIYAVKR